VFSGEEAWPGGEKRGKPLVRLRGGGRQCDVAWRRAVCPYTVPIFPYFLLLPCNICSHLTAASTEHSPPYSALLCLCLSFLLPGGWEVLMEWWVIPAHAGRLERNVEVLVWEISFGECVA